MADLSFNTSNQIIRDLYDTPQEALAASVRLGCSGYRTYLINGQSKYVPCSSYIEYERALRYYVSQGVVGAFGSDSFGDKLVGLQFANSKSEIQGDPFFTLGSFSINKSTIKGRPASGNYKNLGVDSLKSYTLSSIAERNLTYFEGKDIATTINNRLNQLSTVEVLFDKSKLDQFVLYSSLKERFRIALIEISKTYPAALFVKKISAYQPTASEYVEYPNWNQSKFKVNLTNILNPFKIEFTEFGNTLDIDQTYEQYRNFSKTYSNYVVFYNNAEYEILSVTLPANNTDFSTGLVLTINGIPFSGLISETDTFNVPFYIKPKQSLYESYNQTLSDLSSYLLNKNDSGEYYSEITVPIVSNNGSLVNTKKILSFPKYDDFNINMFNDEFDKFIAELNDLAEIYDQEKTNLIIRFLTTDSLKEFDTDEQKFAFILQMYGRMFDSVKKYIDGIQYMRNVSYDKIENIPDLLIKNFATMLGFQTNEIQDEETLFNSLFDYDGLQIEKGLTPTELDIELWRRILINSFYLYKSKGTRKSIDFILKLVGMPDSVFDINEYVYVANNKLNVTHTLNNIYNTIANVDPLSLIENVPFDTEGYPTRPVNVRFQENGGYIYEDKTHIGPYDFGSNYINQFKKFNSTYLFDLQRTIDNYKSWVYSENNEKRIKDINNVYTEYDIKHSDLAINVKELEVYLSLNKIHDITIYRQYHRNLIKLNLDINVEHLDTSAMTFNEFLRDTLTKYINPKNRKTIKTYPTLSKIYYDYQKLLNNPVDMNMSLGFLNKFDSSWVKLIEQFVPATSILNAGKKIQNSQFLDNKFIYKHGQNKNVNWLGTDGSEFQDKATRPSYQGVTNVTSNNGKIKVPLMGNPLTFYINGRLSDKLIGVDPTTNQYFGRYYSLFEYCDNTDGKFYIWDENLNYSDAEFGGDVMITGDTRYGVFVVYNHKLYRLNTKNMFDNPSLITIADYQTSGATQNPDLANINGLKIWEKISSDIDSRIITFKDTPISGTTNNERIFYMTSIGKGLAYIDIGIAFECPPPKPHICYYDIQGSTLNLTSLIGNTTYEYTDDTGITLKIQQPKFYGYSLNKDFLKPDGVLFGKKSNWAVNYQQRLKWIDGKTYYKNEIIADINSSNKSLLNDNPIYLVTGDTFIATGSTYPISALSGLSKICDVSGGIPDNSEGTSGGMFGLLSDRTESDPLMHVNPMYIDKLDLNPNTDVYSINITKTLDLEHVFSTWTGGTSPDTIIRVTDNVIGSDIFISNSLTLSFDGFYPINNENVGPFFITNDEEFLIHTLVDEVLLVPNKQTNISIQSLNESFDVNSDEITLNPINGLYVIQKSSSYTFDINLYFESTLNTNQEVIIRLVNTNGKVYDQESFTFNGLNSAEDRVYNFIYSGIFLAGEQVYLTIEAVDFECTFSRYEKIQYEHSNPQYVDYNPLNDPRFRVFYNNNYQFSNYTGEGYSIAPIYNNNDIEVNSLVLLKNNILNTYYPNTTIFQNLPVISFNNNSSLEFLFNKLYHKYYNKYDTNLLDLNYLVFDKKLNYDKIDFEFKIRSKQLLTNAPFIQNVFGVTYYSTNGTEYEETVSFKNYFLGGTNTFVDGVDANIGISIGKEINKRILNFNKNFDYIPNNSLYSSEIIGTGDTKQFINTKGIETHFSEYQLLNYSNNVLNEIRANRRFSGVDFYYTRDNVIYNSEIYQKLLEIVPEYNKYINNYQLNDIVKYKINSYKTVITTETGDTIEEKDVYRLYVCVNDIDLLLHTNTIESSDLTGEILTIYQPNGSRSCFIEIEKYNTTNYNPWGYDELRDYNFAKRNIKNYTGKGTKQYDESTELQYEFGDIVIANSPFNSGKDDLFRFVYPKNIKYISGKYYQKGEHVYHKVGSTYRFYTAKQLTNTEPTTTNAYWFEHKIVRRSIDDITQTDGKTFNIFTHQSIATDVITDGIPSMAGYYYFSTVCRLPKSYPLIDDSSDFEGKTGLWFINGGPTSSEVNFNNNNPYKSHWNYYDIDIDKLDGYETTNRLSNYIMTGITLDEITYYIHLFIDPETLTDKYINTFDREGVTNIYLKPDANKISLYGGQTPFTNISDNIINKGTYPLFERLCGEDEQNNPKEFLKTINLDLGTFDSDSPYLGSKYVVDRGVLYKVKDTVTISSTTGATEPTFDTDNWTERDFCLVNNFTFYKDRVSVRVFDTSTYGLSNEAKNNLYFYNTNLQLKNGFTKTSFSGATINEKLINAVNFYHDATDENRKSLDKYGSVNFRYTKNSIFMDYYYDKNELNMPITGEFVGKLTVWNPCGQMATTFIGLLLNTDINKVDLTTPSYSKALVTPTQSGVLPYVIRVIVNQTANANAQLVTTKYVNEFTNTPENFIVNQNSKFDKTFKITPNSDFEIALSYDTTNNQTVFKTAYLNKLQIFVDGDYNTNTLKTETIKVNSLETKKVLLKNMSANQTVIINIGGVEKASETTINTNMSTITNTNVKNISL